VAFVAAFAAAGVGLAIVGVRRVESHPGQPFVHMVRLGAAAALHILFYLLVWRGFAGRTRARAAATYLAASFAVLLAAGGPHRAAGLGILVAASAVLALIGDRIARLLLPEDSVSAGAALGFGIAAASVAGSFLAFIGAFQPGAIAAVFAAGTAWGVRGAGTAVRSLRLRLHDIEIGFWTAAGWEIAFLLAAVRIVHGLVPESGFDAVSRYLPYVKILWRFHALPDIPWQFPFILPQAGLAYAGLFGFAPMARRGAFLLAFGAAAALVLRRCRAGRGLALAATLVLVSCPVITAGARGLQPDVFGWLVVLLLAVTATDGASPGTARFGAACGALTALCWCAKYSTLGFAAPLVAWALWRARATGGWTGLGKASAGGVAGAAVVAGPWLFHVWRLARNPFFPLLSSLFPSPLWRMRIDRVWGVGFMFEKGWRGILLWPIDMTFHTNRYVEGPPGNFGFALLVFLLLAAVSIPVLGREEKVWLAAAVVGTALMWTRTPYLRYWLSGLWLAAPAVALGARRMAESRVGETAVAGTLLAVALVQVGENAVHSRTALEGRAVGIFLGRETERDAIGAMPGASALTRLEEIDSSWPKIWYTGIAAVGHSNVIPLMAERWELKFHVPPKETDALARYIDSAGCRYWVVANDPAGRHDFVGSGIPARYWNPSRIVLSDSFVTVYRMPPAEPSSR
jgi:hypothetical protein